MCIRDRLQPGASRPGSGDGSGVGLRTSQPHESLRGTANEAEVGESDESCERRGIDVAETAIEFGGVSFVSGGRSGGVEIERKACLL